MTNNPPNDHSDVLQRLQKYLARCGVASRRSCEELIVAGRVSVNGLVCTELGTKVNPQEDEVLVDGEPVRLLGQSLTIMLNKPVGYVSTMDDPQGRHCVSELVPTDEYPSLFHLGRLDRETSGLLLFSTDGELGNALLHPSRKVQKVYYALVQDCPSEDEIKMLRAGVVIDGQKTYPAEVELLSGKDAAQAREWIDAGILSGIGKRSGHEGKAAARARVNAHVLRIAIHEGRNRQVRKMCEAVGHPVVSLHRQAFGPLNLANLPCGAWRVITDEERDKLLAATRGE